MNICLSTIGTSWTIVPELLGFIAPEQYDFYRQHPQASQIAQDRQDQGIQPADELWLLTTSGPATDATIEQIRQWHQRAGIAMGIRAFQLQAVQDLATHEQCLQMRDACLRLCALAAAKAAPGQLLLCLAGGRKNMSADLQYAATIFGTHALLHIASGHLPRQLHQIEPHDWIQPPSADIAGHFTPAIIDRIPRSPLATGLPESNIEQPPLPSGGFHRQSLVPGTALLGSIQQRQRAGENLHANLDPGNQLYERHSSNYTGLFSLTPRQLQWLQAYRIGTDPRRREIDIALLRTLPKTDLHCHLGGILHPQDILQIASAHHEQLAPYQSILEPLLHAWRPLVDSGDYAGLYRDLARRARPHGLEQRPLRALRHLAPVPEPLVSCAFVQLFAQNPPGLDEFIYGPLRNPDAFRALGFEHYESLGDLQGSSLLQTPRAIEQALHAHFCHAARHCVLYMELRTNIGNLCRGGLDPLQAFALLARTLDDLHRQTGIQARLIITASRHREPDAIRHLLTQVGQILDDPRLAPWLVGLDLAGNEQAMPPEQVREHFLRAMEACLHISIHAGENQPVDNIWAAAYQLSAERIGHGLTLKDNQDLLEHFRDRGIDLEMCPSSNLQIVGYPVHPQPDNPQAYPLREYLQAGLNVTVNTDNPGISRTDWSSELYRAAELSPGGLSLLDIAQIIKNGFSAAFVGHRQRRRLLLRSEQHIMQALRQLIAREYTDA